MNEKFRSVISHSQDDKVKIVYSWFGPKGPVWNTELPNILTLSAEAEGTNPNMMSHHFWCDDVWTKQFAKRKDRFELAPVQAISDDSMVPFIYPFSMTWRIPFSAYFIKDSGVLEFSHMPKELIHMVSAKNGYILIDHSVEAFMSNTELHAMFSYFHSGHQIPMYKIIYLTGTVNASTVYEKFCRSHRISDDREHRMHVIPYASSREIFYNFYTELQKDKPTHHGEDISQFREEPYDDSCVPDKLFLTWNRRFRKHRTSLALILEKNNLIERSLMSFAKIDREMQHHTVHAEIKNQRIGGSDGNPIRLYDCLELDIPEDVAQRFAERCPLEIDGEKDINKMCEDYGYTQPYYRQTLVSLITETNFNTDECTLTEKSFKPMYNKHPFIIVGVAGSLQGLRDLGFKTFGNFWSEEYDMIEEPSKRFIAIEKILQEIASWTPDQILDFKRRAKPIIEHNYNMFKDPGSLAVINNIYEHITNNFNQDDTHWCTRDRRCYFE